MASVFWKDECETKAEELMKKIKYKSYVMKMILKECEDKDGCKGGGSACEISSLRKNSKDQ